VNPFKSGPEKTLQRDLDTARASRDKLAERLKAAELAISEQRAEAQRLARSGADDGALDVAEAGLRGAQDRQTTLTAALAETKAQVAALERARDDLADKKLRSETAVTIEKLALEVAETAAAFDAGAAKLAECTGRAAAIIIDAKGLEIFAKNARVEVSAAVAMISALLRSNASGVLGGSTPAGLPKPEVPLLPKSRPARAPTQSIYALENLKCLGVDGNMQTVAKYTLASLPIPLAEKAIALGKADASGTDRARRLLATYGNSWSPVDAADCYDLTTDTPPKKRPVATGRYHGPVDHPGPLTLPPFVTKTGPAVVGVAARSIGDKGSGK